jgi:Ring finger domain
MTHYHYRWHHQEPGQTFGDIGIHNHCDYCLCYVCNIRFGENGCKSLDHKLAAPSAPNGQNLWPVLRDDVSNLALKVPAENYNLWWTKSFTLDDARSLNLRCPEVPDVMLNAYLADGCDGSVCHLFGVIPRFGQGSGCKQSKSLLDFVKLLCPEGRVTKAMIGNGYKPFDHPENGIFVTLQYEQVAKKLTVRAYVKKEGYFCSKLPAGTSAGFTEHGLVTLPAVSVTPPVLSTGVDGSVLVSHQLHLLQNMCDNETLGIRSRLWHETDAQGIQMSKVSEFFVRQCQTEHILDSGIAGGVVSMPVCSGKSRVVAALLASRREQKTLIVIKSDHAAWHWINECKMFGIDCQHISNKEIICTSNTCVVTWNVVAESGRTWFADRVVYDDFLRFIVGVSPIAAACVWALTTPEQMLDGKRKYSSIIRFLFTTTIKHVSSYATSGNVLAGGMIARICAAGCEPDAFADKLAKDVQPILTLTRSTAHVVREQERQTIIYKPSPTWAAEYREHTDSMKRNHVHVSERMMGAVAGNNDVFFDKVYPPDLPTLPPDIDTCCICTDGFDRPCRLPCGHFTCYVCVMKWVAEQFQKQTAPTCPLCRTGFSCENLVQCRPERSGPILLNRNINKLNCVVETCLQRLRFPRARILLLSRFPQVRKTLISKLQEHQFNCLVTSDINTFFSSRNRDDTTGAVLVASPAELLKLRITGQANVVIFAEPCVEKALAKAICKQVTSLDSQHEVSVLTIVTSGTYEEELCNSAE